MDLKTYNEQALQTLTTNYAYGDISPQMMGLVLGLAGESGEVTEKIKKLLRDKQGLLSDEDKQAIIKELGDVLWYVAAIAHLLGSNLDTVATQNLQKLADRYQRGTIHGSGDDR
jgi:NTP pyrophosphatase (non-canonical NTP hydrolase)